MEIKYVVLGQSHPILFSAALKHSDFKKMVRITSAGFVDVQNPDEPVVYGRSSSLNIGPDPYMDQILIKILLRHEV